MNPLEKIRSVFTNRGYRQTSLLNQQEFISILTDLNGKKFDEEVALEIWDEAILNSRQQATINQICGIIYDAQNILTDKLIEVEDSLEDYLEKKESLEAKRGGYKQKLEELDKINSKIDELRTDKNNFEQDLILVTEPFGIDYQVGREAHRATGLPKQGRQSKRGAAQYLTSQQNISLQHLFYIMLIMILIEIVVIFKKYDFLNLLVIVTSMSMFVLNYFDNTYLKICGGLTGVSIAADFTWLIMYAGSYWSPHVLSEHSSGQAGYLKLIVLLTVVNIGAKVYYVYLILKQENIDSGDDFIINPFEGVTFNVSANTGNIVSRTCKGNESVGYV